MQTPVSRTDTTTSYEVLKNKTSPEREGILTSSSRKGAKHPVEQREQLKGELIHQMLHEMRIDESKLSINQVHCVQSGKRCPYPCAPSQHRTGSCGRKYIFKLHWEKTLWKRSNRANQNLSTPASFFPPWGCMRWDWAVLPCGSQSVTAFTSLPSISSHTDSCWVKVLYLVTGSLWEFGINFYIL